MTPARQITYTVFRTISAACEGEYRSIQLKGTEELTFPEEKDFVLLV